ncbi:hypothetical protein [Caballeronia sp. INDeC2]|uniref:hypothetical protein n=1 Tax=Caballeronia sp. INDeC2 TaxID=2921747 RepID=UPI0020286182|nr:hypothetical protein [Caballeronia sp. INDeC2]
MALDSSFKRENSGDAQQNGEGADESDVTSESVIRPTSSGVSVTLWDEFAPAPTHTPPFADDSLQA